MLAYFSGEIALPALGIAGRADMCAAGGKLGVTGGASSDVCTGNTCLFQQVYGLNCFLQMASLRNHFIAADAEKNALYGARGEAAQGFPSAMECALPALQLWLKRGADFNRASVAALLHLIGQIDDTNMIHRGGVLEARRRRLEAAELYDILTVDTIIPTATALDESYIRANLSPGGCADMLAVSLFLFFVLNEKIVIY